MSKKMNPRKIKFWVLSVFLLAITPANSQLPGTAWEKQIPVSSSHYFSDVMETSEGHFILLGAIEMQGDRKFDIWLVECNDKGDTIKTRVIDHPGNDIPMSITSSPGNEYVVACLSQLPDSGIQACLIALDAALTTRWTNDAARESILLHSDVATDESGQIWWLNTFSDEKNLPEVSLWKLNRQGVKTDEWIIQDHQPMAAYNIRRLKDGMMAITCQVPSPEGYPTVMVIKLDALGTPQWNTLIPTTGKSLTPHCICCGAGGDFLLVGGWAGLCYNPDAPAEEQVWDYDYLLSKLDTGGKINWSKNYNREGSERGSAMAVLPDGNIMAAGKCETSFSGTTGIWLLFVDANGEIVNEEVTRFHFIKDQVARIICTSDGGFLMVGPGWIETESQISGWIRKLNPVM